MHLSRAFLVSLLFFGVTPLAIEPKRDERVLATTFNSFAPRASVALVAPDDAVAEDLKDLMGGAPHPFEVRARIGRYSRRGKTTSRSEGDAITTTEDFSQRSDLRLEIKAKADPKSKETAPCTIAQKKTGKCPVQQNKKNWEVLIPPRAASLSLAANVSHHWQNTAGDDSYKDLPPVFDNAFTNPRASGRRSSFKLTDLTDAQKKVVLAYQSEADVKCAVDDVFPKTGFESLTKFKPSFTAASKVQSMVAVWDGITGSNGGDKFKITGPHMRKIVDDLLPGTATKLVEYKSTADAANDADDDENYHGKIIVSYDSGTKKFQVWMPAAQSGAPILKN